MNKKQIFVAGWGGSGSRVPQMILEKAGYFVGRDDYLNQEYDLCGKPVDESITNITKSTPKKLECIRCFDEYFFKNNPEAYKDFLDEVLDGRDSWSLKVFHFMFFIPLLKKWYPDSKFIYTLRNPIDNMLNKYDIHHKYGGLPLNAPIENKVKYHLYVTKMVLEDTDFIVKLEDLCFNTNETITDLLAFANVENNNIEEYAKLIQIPKSIGRGKEYYEKFKEMKEFEYIKELGYLLD